MDNIIDNTAEAVVLLRKEIPPPVRVSDAEIKRRQAIGHQIEHLREEIGPIGIRSDDLLYESRKETER